MSTTITIPELGEGVDSVDVVSVLVEVGDTVEVDQPLIEVETDKAAVEVPSTVAGTVTEILVSAGDSLGPDAAIVVVDEAAGTAATEITSETVTETEADTESASASDPVPDPDPDPEIAPPPAPASEPAPAAGDSVSTTDQEQQPAPEPASAPPTPDDSRLTIHDSRPSAPLIPAAPTVRRFAREVGIDIATVQGSGPGGRISIDDVKTAVQQRLAQPSGGVGIPQAELPDFSRWGEIRREPMTKVRTLTAEAMSRAWLTAPQVTNHDIADITELEELRRSYKARVEAAGGKLTMTAILVKVVASALKLFPTLNASIDSTSEEIIFKDYINIGVAVDTDRGLLVPVIRNADQKNITEIAIELGDLAGRARSRRLKPDEMQGGTFSISNLGGIGGTGFSPIVNWPEVAILGVSRGRIRPEWDDELSDFYPRLMLPLSLSYDHRLVDGAVAARFNAWLVEALQSPLLLALEG